MESSNYSLSKLNLKLDDYRLVLPAIWNGTKTGGISMNLKMKNLLDGKGKNYIFPFLWLHGEEEQVLREYMGAIHDSGIGAVCVESRPHPDYCGPQWWHDMDIILDEAKERDMKVWILDDSHFPTGYANGALADEPAELHRQFLYYSSVEVLGPMRSMQLNITKHASFIKDPFAPKPFFSKGNTERRQFDDDALISVAAARIDQGFDASTLIDLTGFVKDEMLVWDVPAGKWMIYVNFVTRNAGSQENYINMMNKRSAAKQLEAVYEPHFEHYPDEFGKTIAGFFSDEPELGNGALYTAKGIGEDQDLPWSEEVAEQLANRLGVDWKTKLPLLWEKSSMTDTAAQVRHTYMDIVTRLVEENFSRKLGQWCEAHGVEYIGHLIEDNNSDSKLGPSLGHYFRGLSGQHMSGIDDIGGQVLPSGELYPVKGMFSKRDGEFFHYMLGKLGSSLGAIDPIKNGRTMCEIFGAYGWSEGVRMMKYLVDHFLVRGVNHYVPHAFSAKGYPDPDCPPHFYANGHDPQYRHFGALMRYLNRMCDLINGGARVTPAAILYHADAEWAGDYMLAQKPAHALMDHQIDFDVVPSDVFAEPTRYRTELGSQLTINGHRYEVLVVPFAQYMTKAAVMGLAQLKKAGFPVLFIDALPTGIVDGDNELLNELKDFKVISLNALVDELMKTEVAELSVEPAFPMLRYLHYREDKDLYLFTNENMAETFKGTVTVGTTGPVYGYDAWSNKLYEVKSEQKGQRTELTLEIQPYQSVVVVFDDASGEEITVAASFDEEVILSDGWRMSLATATEYPIFHDEQSISSFENVGLKYMDFSGFIRYENSIELGEVRNVTLTLEDAFEGVEVFVNDVSAGIQVVPTFSFEIGKLLKKGNNKLRIEVATTLERERTMAPPVPGDFFAMLSKGPAFTPTGIVGEVKLLIQR